MFVITLTDNDHRLGVDNLWWWGVAELYLSIDTRTDLTADTKIDNGQSCMSRKAGENKGCKRCG